MDSAARLIIYGVEAKKNESQLRTMGPFSKTGQGSTASRQFDGRRRNQQGKHRIEAAPSAAAGGRDTHALRDFPCDAQAGIDSSRLEFGAEAWEQLFGSPRPAELHVFREFHAGSRHAVSTRGDILLHIRARRMDLCFELATQIMTRIGHAVEAADEVHGFRYFDNRDLIGFVDGTENPQGEAAIEAVLVGEEDTAFAGGSYVIVQKYLHDLGRWDALSTEQQEGIIGRKKLSGVELDDSVKPISAHNALTTITKDGKEVKLLVDDKIIWAPAIEGAFVVTTRGGDFELHLGQDLSIGYLSHTDDKVRLYLQETFTFLLLVNCPGDFVTEDAP